MKCVPAIFASNTGSIALNFWFPSDLPVYPWLKWEQIFLIGSILVMPCMHGALHESWIECQILNILVSQALILSTVIPLGWINRYIVLVFGLCLVIHSSGNLVQMVYHSQECPQFRHVPRMKHLLNSNSSIFQVW